MSEDHFTEVEHEGWLGRMGNAIGGVLVGILLFIAAFPLLWWNEGRAVQTAKSLAEGAAAVVTVDPETVDSAHEGDLVHLTGRITTEQTLTDPLFGLSVNAIKLRRVVEMYQWEEDVDTRTEKELGGGTKKVKEYSYHRVWSDEAINSSGFKQPEGHQNPPAMPAGSDRFVADSATLGGYRIPQSLIGQMHKLSPVTPDADELSPPEGWSVQGGRLFKGEGSLGSPKVGDARVTFTAQMPTDVSIIAQQVGDTLQPYQTEAGDPLEMLEYGVVSADQMFQQAIAENEMWTWILRAAGVLAMGAGVFLVLKPFAVVADIIPILGDLASFGIGIFAAMVALPLSLLTISLAWLFYRPLIGVPLFAVGLLGIFFIGYLAASSRGRRRE